MQHVVRSVRKLHRKRTISSLGTISIERERLHELRQNKEDMCITNRCKAFYEVALQVTGFKRVVTRKQGCKSTLSIGGGGRFSKIDYFLRLGE